MPPFVPRNYDIHAWTINEARKFLDVKYSLGWRVVKMSHQVGSRKIVFLFEKVDTPKRPKP